MFKVRHILEMFRSSGFCPVSTAVSIGSIAHLYGSVMLSFPRIFVFISISVDFFPTFFYARM